MNAKQTPTPFRFDGHGINDANGQRVCKVSSCEPYIYETGQPQRNPEFDRLSNLFAAAPELLFALRQILPMIQFDPLGETGDASDWIHCHGCNSRWRGHAHHYPACPISRALDAIAKAEGTDQP